MIYKFALFIFKENTYIFEDALYAVKTAKKAGYKKKIIKLCKDAGTYADYFDMTYDNLAYLMEVYDKAKNQFKASGEKPVIAYTNTAGKTNLVENPALTAINKLSGTMLTYYEKHNEVKRQAYFYKYIEDLNSKHIYRLHCFHSLL